MIKLSIIIPVYNAQKTLDRCLSSLLTQSETRYEILLIDDGSTDNSGIICDKYSSEHKQIKTFHIQNGGVSHARNLGMEKASAEFITFIDSDDYVSSNYFATVFNFIENPNSDCLLFNLYREESKDNFIAKKIPIKEGVYKNPENLFQYSLAFYSFFNASYTKIYKKSIIVDNNIKFNERIKLCEDNIFSLDYISAVKTYTICEAPLYFYTVTFPSATQKRKLQYFADDEFLFLKYLNIIESKDYLHLSKDRLFNTYLRRCFYNINNLLSQKISKKEIRKALNSTTLIKHLLTYKFKLNSETKLQAKRLKYFSKGHFVLYKLATLELKFAKKIKKILTAIK